MSTAAIIESMVLVKPSETLCSSIKKLNPALNMPSRIKYLFLNSTIKDDDGPNHHKLISLSTDDYEELHRLEKHHKTKDNSTEFTTQDIETFSWDNEKGYLCVEDLVWLHRHLNDQNVHLHELLSSSTVCVPENQKIERNPELEKRCIRLKIQQENRVYKSMTKNVDNMRIHYPEDTIAYQIKQFNKQLIAVFQFIVSVLTGFAFGFIGIELMVGTLDFGFKLLLGIMCSLIIALAELYFLAKQLNEI